MGVLCHYVTGGFLFVGSRNRCYALLEMDNHKHLINHIKHPGLVSNETLHVIGVISNPMRYHSRLRIFRDWYAAMLQTPNVEVYVVECAFGDRHHEVTETGHPNHLQLRTDQEIWNKESMINLAIKHLLPFNWKYVCWSDCDVFWVDPNWATEAMNQLQHHPIIQPWRDCLDLGFLGTVLQHFQSFCYVHRTGVKKQCHPSQPYKYAHSGFAWACRRSFWEQVEKLLDWGILGSSDHHMAWATINGVHNSVHAKMHPNFHELCDEWQRKAWRACHGQVGFVPTRIEHKFHGPKNRRQYRERWQILIDHHFDPLKDLSYDQQGLIKLLGKPHLLQACRDYFSFRHEDSIEES